MHIGVLSDPNNFHTQKWAQGLHAAGAGVTVFSMFRGAVPGIPSVYIPPQFTRGGQLTYFSYLYTLKGLREALTSHGVDVVNPINITPFGVWAARAGVSPIAAVAMGADILEYPPKRSARDFPDARAWARARAAAPGPLGRAVDTLKWHGFRREVHKALHAATFITADNLVLVDAVKNWFAIPPDKVHLNRWGIEPARFEVDPTQRAALRQKFGIEADQRVILSPRGMKPIYQGDLILNSFEQLLNDGPDRLKLIMFSAGYDIPESLRQQARQLAARDTRFFFQEDLLPREEVLALWSLVDIMISAPVYDGFSNALCEACYAGVIPVVNDIPATREWIVHQQNGWVIAPFTSDNLTKSLKSLLADLPTWKQRFSAANRCWVQAHALLDANIQAFLRLCETCH